ncbi:MAG: MarR family transcriptional regulator [Mobilitalea sp.]
MINDFELLISGQQFKKVYEKKYNRITEKYGLHRIEIEILIFLQSTPHDTAKDIAEYSFFSKAHISKAIEDLVQRGYLRGKPDEEDRRCIHLQLKEESLTVINEIKELRRNLSQVIYSGVSDEEKKIIFNVSKKIVRNINNELLKENKR